MTAEIFNLKRARKAKARQENAAEAASNRAKFGRTKAERRLADTDRERAAHQLDGAKRTQIGPDVAAANDGEFAKTAQHGDDGLDPGAVS